MYERLIKATMRYIAMRCHSVKMGIYGLRNPGLEFFRARHTGNARAGKLPRIQ